MFKKVSLILLASLFLFAACDSFKSPTTPEIPDLEPTVEYRSYWIEYRVEPEWIANANYSYAYFEISIMENGQPNGRIRLEKVNDYLFRGELNNVCCRKEYDNRTFDWFTFDLRRDPLSWEEKITFGNIFVFEEKETGVRTELTNIRDNTYRTQDFDYNGTMVRHWILHDGAISNVPPNNN